MQDILDRWLARRQMTQRQYDAGRKWQEAWRAQDKEVLERLEVLKGIDRYGLLIEVLGGQTLANAVASRGGDSRTGSTDMRMAGFGIRHLLDLIANLLTGQIVETSESQELVPSFKSGGRRFRERAVTSDPFPAFGRPSYSGFSKPSKARIEDVLPVARELGYRLIDNGTGTFDLRTLDGRATNIRGYVLDDIAGLLMDDGSADEKAPKRTRRRSWAKLRASC